MGVAVGSNVGAAVAVGKSSTAGRLVGDGRATGMDVGEGVPVGMTAAAGIDVLTGTGLGVGMGVDAMDAVGSGGIAGNAESPAALPKVTNTAAMVTADTIKSPRRTGTTGNERRGVNSWCCLTSRSSKFSRRKNTDPSFSNKVMIIANSIYTPPTGTGQAGPKPKPTSRVNHF